MSRDVLGDDGAPSGGGGGSTGFDRVDTIAGDGANTTNFGSYSDVLGIVTLSANHTETITGIATGKRVTFRVTQPGSGGPYTFSVNDGSTTEGVTIKTGAGESTSVLVMCLNSVDLAIVVLDTESGTSEGSGDVGAHSLPADHGVKAWSFPSVGYTPETYASWDNGYMHGVRIRIREAFTIGSIRYLKKANGSGASNYNGIGIYKVDGGTATLIGKTADLGVAWTAGDQAEAGPYTGVNSGVHSKAVVAESGQSLTVVPGDTIYGVFLMNMTSPFQTIRVTPYGLANFGLSGMNVNSFESSSGGKTALPATFVDADIDEGRPFILWLALGT